MSVSKDSHSSFRRRSRSPIRESCHRHDYHHHQDQRKRNSSRGNESNKSNISRHHYDSKSRPHDDRSYDRSYRDDRRRERPASYDDGYKRDHSRGSLGSYDEDRRDGYHGDRFFNDRKRNGNQEPNINVVLRNLPDRAREIDIQRKLAEMGASIDDVSLIRDRETGESRKFAFVRFTSVGHAIQFVEKYNTFEMNSYFVRVDYCKKDKQNENKEEWRCTKCGSFNPVSRRACVECRQSFISEATETRSYEAEEIEINDGTKDMSDMPNKMLLLRQLDHLSTEESIYNAIESFQGVYRAILIRDKLTKMSCEFAFVEFTDAKSAYMALESSKDKLMIDGRKVIVSFAKADSFIPVYGQSEWAISADTMEGAWAYWDKNVYASEYSQAIEEERRQKEEERKRVEEELEKTKEEEQRKAQEVKNNNGNSLEDDLSAFYADMDAFGADDSHDTHSCIFAVPKLN